MSHTYAVKTVKTQMTEMQSKERLNIQKNPTKTEFYHSLNICALKYIG